MDSSDSSEQMQVGQDLLYTWLEHSRSAKTYVKTFILNRNYSKFFMFACKKLKQHKTVFYTSVEVAEKYFSLHNCRNRHCNPAIITAVIIFISNKSLGYAPALDTGKLLDFLHEQNFGEFDAYILLRKEREILIRIQYSLPNSTIFDEMNLLYDYYINNLNLCVNLRPQCVQIMKFYYHNAAAIHGVLQELYANNTEHFEIIITNRLFVPTGVIICAVSLSEGLNLMNCEELINKLSALLNIPSNDLETVYLTILEAINMFKNDDNEL